MQGDVVKGTMNWYAIQTVKGQEEYVKAEAESFVSDVKFILHCLCGKKTRIWLTKVDGTNMIWTIDESEYI